ncbi:MAG TPA: ABC transporter permease, partial [Calditrichia bacterium]|nr:ABC transporter permease [Calditrichia bacterium]
VKRFFVIAAWELLQHLRRRSFMGMTVVMPLVITALILIPLFYYQTTRAGMDLVIGMVEVDTSGYFPKLTEKLILSGNQQGPLVLLEPIEPDTSLTLLGEFGRMDTLRHQLDSLQEAYNRIKEQRNYYFRQPPSRTRERNLSRSYDELLATRENRDLTEVTLNRHKTSLDSVWQVNLVGLADSLLKTKRIAGYVLINGNTFKDGMVEFHSEQPINFLRLNPLRNALQVLLVEERMAREGTTVDKIQELLSPINIQEMLLEDSGKHEFKFLTTYLTPAVIVLLLFVAVFTPAYFLFSTVSREKHRRLLPVLLSSVSPANLIAGKVVGLWLLGAIQVGVWILIATLLRAAGFLPAEDLRFLNLTNAGLFFMYYTLGYALFSAIFISLAALSRTRQDGQTLLVMLGASVVLLIGLMSIALLAPDSLMVRLLSYVPFLTPAFMILRIPLAYPPQVDFYVTAVLCVVVAIVLFLVAYRIFRQMALSDTREMGIGEIISELRGS